MVDNGPMTTSKIKRSEFAMNQIDQLILKMSLRSSVGGEMLKERYVYY